MSDACTQCGSNSARNLCSGCRSARYCSRECQRANWREHKPTCLAARREAERHSEEVWEAARDDDLRALQSLVADFPASVNTSGGISGCAPLTIAAACGNVDCVKFLLSKGANVHRGDDSFGQRPIHRAAEAGEIDAIRVLLDAGADVCGPDGMGQTPLHFAAENGHADCIRLLLREGAAPSLRVLYRGRLPEQWAAGNGHESCAELLRSARVS